MTALIEFDRTNTAYVIREYTKGFSMTVIAEEFGVSVTTIRRVLLDADVTIRPRGRQPQD